MVVDDPRGAKATLGPILIGLALLLSAGALAATGEDAGKADPPARGLAVGEALPHFLLRTLNPDLCGGEVFSTKHFVGVRPEHPQKALVLSFAASYCKPCREEIPALARLAEGYADRDVRVGVVILDRDEDGLETMRRFTVEELALRLPVVADRYGIVGRRYGATELPCLVVSDGSGRIRWLNSGYREDTLKRLKETLEALAPAPVAAPAAPPSDEPSPPEP